MRARLALALLATLALGGCRSSKPSPPRPEAGAPAPPPPPAPVRPAEPAPLFDFVASLARCDVEHRGALLDLGTSATQALSGGWALAPDPSLVEVEHDGATWTRVMGKSLSVRFVTDEPAPLAVLARIRGVASKSAAVTIDGKPLGTLAFARGQMRIVSTRATGSAVAAGPHTLGLRFSGATKNQVEPLAEIDWVRVGPVDEETGTYAAPTQNEMITNVALGAVPHRSIALRAPARVGCTTFIPPGARLRTAVGFTGAGEAEAELRVVRDGEAPVVLQTERVLGGDKAAWTPIDVPLDRFAGKLATLELVAKGGTPGGRLLFGDPAVRVPAQPTPEPPSARLVLVLALSGLEATRLPPRAAEGALPALADLERISTSFRHHRAPTTVTAGVLATMLTGSAPRTHQLEDTAARLPASLTTLATAARDGSIQTAMFTGSPTTFQPFGLARGWDKFTELSPVSGAPATAPITEAAAWIGEHMRPPEARALVVVHARGGHPPWDVPAADVANLPPPEYSGPMEPRRGAQVIARARGKKTRFRLTEHDRTRMWALYEAGLSGQDRAIGALVESLRKSGLWDRTLLVVTGDVAVHGASRAPFGDGDELSETLLDLPLWVRFPGGALAGTKIDAPTSVADVPRTVLDALRLAVPDGFEGIDLFATASGGAPLGGRPQWATFGPRFSTRWGDLLLTGQPKRAPVLCDLAADPTCETDKLDAMPLAARALFRVTYDAEQAAAKRRRTPREPATIDAETAAALQVWGQ